MTENPLRALFPPTHARHADVLWRHCHDHETYRAIAGGLGVHPCRARQIALRAEQMLRRATGRDPALQGQLRAWPELYRAVYGEGP